ncbi:hypothetical protein CC79DRAFT_461984 [Sarocladium strictum]
MNARDSEPVYQTFQVSEGLVANEQSSIVQNNNNYHQEKDDKPRTLQDAIHFPELASREHTVALAHADTGRWLLNTKEYLDWAPSPRIPNQRRPNPSPPSERSRSCWGCLRAPRHIAPEPAAQEDWKQRLLWIKGNAGAGKSTLIKLAIEDAKKRYTEALILPHFFNARGAALEKSTEGMYRTLLFWLLDKIPQVDKDSLMAATGTSVWVKGGRKEILPVPQLVRLLQGAIALMPKHSIMFFVDALDECNKEDVRDMLEVFRSLVESRREVRVFFASRPHPHVGFDGAVFLDLGEQTEHIKDIEEYIDARLRIGSSTMAMDIRKELRKKAGGVFMWVVLVVDILNVASDNGSTIMELQHQLAQIPDKLHGIYGYTLKRYPDDGDAMLVCFQWLLYGIRQLDVEKLWWGVQLGLERTDKDISRDYTLLDEEIMERYIVRISKGLIEFKIVSGYRRAQFIHESVRDFIFKESSLQLLYGAQNVHEFEGRSQEQLGAWCTAEMVARRPQLAQIVGKDNQRTLSDDDLEQMGWSGGAASRAQFPFAQYAFCNVWVHAEAAQRCGRDQTAFLDTLQDRIAPYFLTDLVTVYGSVIGPLLQDGYEELIRKTQMQPAQRARQRGIAFGLIDSYSPHSPLVSSQEWGHIRESADALISIYLRLDLETRHPVLQQLLEHLARESRLYTSTLHGRYMPRFGALLDLAYLFNPPLATFLLLALTLPPALEPHLNTIHNCINSDRRPEVQFAQVLHHFIEHDILSDAIDYKHEGTLLWATRPQKGKEERYGKAWEESQEEREVCASILTLLHKRYS